MSLLLLSPLPLLLSTSPHPTIEWPLKSLDLMLHMFNIGNCHESHVHMEKSGLTMGWLGPYT